MCTSNLVQKILILVLALSLAACSGSPTVEPVTTDSPPVSQPLASQPEPTPLVAPAEACPPLEPHPIAVSITETFEVSYEQIMEWYCQGESFDDILLALETEELTGVPAAELLTMKDEMDWDQIWQELDIEP